MEKLKWILILAICVVIIFYVTNSMFFFNPLTYKSMIGTNRAWFEYRKPLRIEYEFWNTTKPKNIWSYDEKEIKFIYKELDRSIEVTPEEYMGSKRLVWFHIRRLSDGEILIMVDISNNQTAKIGDNTYVKVTRELWDYLLKVQQRAENVPKS